MENPVSKNEELKEELELFKAELKKQWECKPTSVNKSEL
jgi:hypothetical protein